MAKQRTVVLPDYPSILLKPMGHSWSGRQIEECLDALAVHYGLDGLFSSCPLDSASTCRKAANLSFGESSLGA